MASGIVVPDAIINAFKDVKQRKLSAAVIKIHDENLIVEKEVPPSKGNPVDEWKDAVSGLNENECRFILCDFQVKETELVMKGKLVIISYSPDYASVRHKMIYASTLTNLTNHIEVQKTIQATEPSEVAYDVLKDAIFSH